MKEEENQIRYYNDILMHLTLFLEMVVKNYQVQLRKNTEHSKQVRQSPYELVEPEILASYDLERLKNLNTDEVFVAYRYYLKGNEDIDGFKKLFSNIDFLYRIFQDLEKSNEKYQNFIHKDILVIRDCCEVITYHIGMYVQKMIKHEPLTFSTRPEFIFLKHYDDIYHEITMAYTDFLKLKIDFLIPLRDALLKDYVDSEYAGPVVREIKIALNRFRNIEVNSEDFSKVFEDGDKNISESLNKIEELRKNIKHALTSL